MHLNIAKTTAVLFNVGMIVVFARALLFPETHAEWIFGGAFLIFIFEFLALFTSAGILKMKVSSRGLKADSLFPIVVVCGYAVLFSFLTGNLLAGGYFIVSTLIKLFDQKTNERESDLVMAIVGMLLTLVFVMFTTPLWVALFPFSKEVLSQGLDGSSGFFVDTPQTLLIWGMLYFGWMIWYELKREQVDAWLKKHKKKKSP